MEILDATALAVRQEEAVEGVNAKPCPNETYGVNPQVCAKAAKPSPRECTQAQLLEIVIGVARRFGGAKADVATHKEYILRLKNEVFKVSFGSVGVFVPVKYKTKEGKLFSKKMRWKEFCKTQFGVSADWISRICGGKAESRGKSRATKPEPETAPYKHGYQAAKAEVQMQLNAAAEKQATLASRITALEKENEKLQRTAHQSQAQSQAGESKLASQLGKQLNDINDIETLAAEAFRIINGNFGQRLMGSPEGNRLVGIAKKAAAMKGRIKVC
jgi:regulator of replication initiation timing